MDIKLDSITKIFQAKDKAETVAVKDLDIVIPSGKLVGLLGPSGCGKSTTLYMIAGLLEPNGGRIYFGDEDVTDMAPEDRGIGLVFQNYALYPHMTVRQNIMFPLENIKVPKVEALQRAQEMADLVGIGELMDRKPKQLSGGQQQRVAIARALVKKPRVLLLDEPLSNLDAKLRIQVRDELADLHQRIGSTFLYVTHDQTEALTLSNRVAVMDQGQILQIGTPSELYESPANLTVAKFIGTPSMNILPLEMGSAQGLSFSLATPSQLDQSQLVIKHIGIRPEHLLMGSSGHALPSEIDVQLEATVHRTEHHGAEWIYILKLAQWNGALLTARVSTQKMSKPLASGTEVLVGWRLADLHLFDATGSRVSASPQLIN